MELASDFRETVIPVMVFFVLLDLTGFFGNIMVMYVFTKRYKRNRFRSLVLGLAVVDLISCCTTVPMETVSTWFWFDTPSRGLCKAKNFFVQFSATSSIYMLFVTAMYKFRRICKPYGWQISKHRIAILILSGLILSLCVAVPAAVFWGMNNHSVDFNNKSEITRICEVLADYRGTAYPIVYRGILSLYNILLVATVILYVFVARKTIKHFRQRQSIRKVHGVLVEESATSTGDQTNTSNDTEMDPSGSRNNMHVEVRWSQAVKASPVTPRSLMSATQIRSVCIMLIIVGTFSVTFVLGLAFGFVFALRDYGDFNSNGEIVWMFAVYKFYYMNYAMNPVVYFILDRQYNKHVVKFLRCSKCK